MKVALHTYGCKVNSYETEVIRQQILNSNIEIFDENADVHIINTCTVTKKIDTEIYRKIKQLKKNGKKVILTGCLVERKDKEALSILSLADDVVSNKSKFQINNYFNFTDNINYSLLSDFSTRDRAFIKIEDGCDNFCSYCEVPYVRGTNIKSRDIDIVKKEFLNLVNAGFNEIVLTGVNLGFYGKDKNDKNMLFRLLVELIAEKPNTRIRLSSIGPKELSDDIIRLIKDSDGLICPHFHLSLQSGDEKILKLMNRNYTPEEYKEKVNTIISEIPYAAITTDIIAGFPNETEKEFKNTFDFIKELPFSRLHVFPFSKRPDTVASKMKEQVNETEKKLRVNTMIKLGKLKEKNFAQKNLGLIRKVLVETDKKNNYYTGYTDNYIRVKFRADNSLIGKLADIKLIEYKDDFVYGEILK